MHNLMMGNDLFNFRLNLKKETIMLKQNISP